MNKAPTSLLSKCSMFKKCTIHNLSIKCDACPSISESSLGVSLVSGQRAKLRIYSLLAAMVSNCFEATTVTADGYFVNLLQHFIFEIFATVVKHNNRTSKHKNKNNLENFQNENPYVKMC